MDLGLERIEGRLGDRGSGREASDQVFDAGERLDAEPVVAFTPEVVGLDQSGLREQTKVPADRGARHRVRSSHVDDSQRTADQAEQQVAPKRIGQGSEDVHGKMVTD
jgi:hypothetical protein